MYKKSFLMCIITVFFIVSVYARETIVSVFKDSKKETNVSSKKNIAKYKKSADNYWKYLSQLLTLSGYEKL